MKLSRIKNVLIGFIVAMISIFCYSNRVQALDTITLDFSGSMNNYNNLSSYLNEVHEYLDSFGDTYYYYILLQLDSFNVYVAKPTTNLSAKVTVDSTSYSYSIYSSNKSIYYYGRTFNISNFNDEFTWLKNAIENDSFSSNKLSVSGSYSLDNVNNTLSIGTISYIYATNAPYTLSASTVNVKVGDTVYSDGDTFATFSDYINDMKTIKLSKAYANDLNGNDVYIITSDFSQVFSENYTYQIRTDYTDWVDITSSIIEASQYDVYSHQYETYYNTTFYARVLDSNGDVVDEDTIEVNELNNFDMLVSHAIANDEQGRFVNVVTIDLRNCWNNEYTYQYSYDNETFYNMNVDENNRVFYLSQGIQTFLYFRILDKNGSVIYTKDYEEIFSGLDTKVILEVNPYTNAETQEKTIEITVDFSLYSRFKDLYPNMRFYINDELITSDTKTYILTKENYADFQEIDVNVYIDNFWVEGWCYSPHYGDMGDTEDFDDKYEEIVLDKLEDELNNGDFSSSEGWYKSIETFINAIRDIVTKIIDLIMGFFNRLNAWIRVLIISLFIVLVVTRVIKVVRK